MPPTLQDFNKPTVNKEQLRMDAFQPRVQPSPAANSPTVNTLATYGAALVNDGTIDQTYQSITNQLSYSASSNTLDTILRKWDENDIEGSMSTLKQVLIDPNVSDEDKQNTLLGFQTGQWQTNLASRVAIAATEAPNAGENGEQEDMRIKVGAAFDEVDSYQSWLQQNINALKSESNPSYVTNVKAMIESFYPFTDATGQAFFESIVNAEGTGGPVNTVQNLLLMGEGKERLRTTLANIPVEQRKPIVQNIINVIRSIDGTVANDTVKMKQIQSLEQMLVPGAYRNEDRWADNVFAVLDDTVLLSPFTKPIRGLLGGLKGAGGTRVAEETIARGARVSEPPQLLLEYKPAPVSYTDDIDAIVDSLPIEPTYSQITELRDAVMGEIGNANGFSIDNVIDRISVGDELTSSQIITLRGQLGKIRDKRTTDLNSAVPPPVPTITEAQRVHVSSNVQPTAVSQIHKDTNPSIARVEHEAVIADETGNAARILYGTDRNSALANDFLPEIGGNGRVRAKLEFGDAVSKPDVKILQHVKDSDGAIWADGVEKTARQDEVISDWRNTIGVSNRSAMASIENIADKTDTGVRFSQTFGPKEGGFSNAFTGVDVVRASLRKYGVKDEELVVLARQADGNYGPVHPKQDLKNGDFLIQVKHDYKFDPKEIKFGGFDVSPLWGFITIPDLKIPGVNLRQGGITQHVVPKSVNIDKRAYTAGVSAADKSAGLQKQLLRDGNEFGKKWSKLPSAQKDAVDNYIRKANEEEIPFNVANIKGMGISDEGVDVLVDWKRIQDTIGVLENADAARTLRDEGYELFEHRASDTRLIVEPMKRGSVVFQTKIYNPTLGDIVTMTKKELDDLYAAGGSIGKLRRADEFNGETVEHVVMKNNADGGFARRIRDTDRILNYRHGYYHVRYTDPYYITRVKKDAQGKVIERKVIARAETKKDADIEKRRLNDTKDGYEYEWKPDDRANPSQQFNDALDVSVSAGRSAQRLRGKRLDRVGQASDKTISDSGLESPIDSLTRSISSIAHRTSFRNVIDAEKRRWMSQWKDLTAQPGKFPLSVDDIKSGSGMKEMAKASDARHAYRHIEALQDGHANLIDDASKAFFGMVSDVTPTNGKGWAWVDKLARGAAKVSPSAMGRLTAFRLFLAANPARQLPLQALPALPIISATNPLGWGRVVKQATLLAAFHRGVDPVLAAKIGKITGTSPDEIKELIKDYELSGMSAAVNAHSYMADDFAKLADKNIAQRAASIAGKPLRIAQSVGFDLGEQTLMTLTWLSNRDVMLRQLGKKSLTAAERESLTARTRAMTGDMNKGGEMPYNSNTFSIIMQFLQSPHKVSSGLILGHKGLTGWDRAKLATSYTVVFGVPTIPIIKPFLDNIIPPDKPEAREIIEGGLTNMALNRYFSAISGSDVNIDFSGSLQPFSTEPLTDFIGGFFGSSLPELVMGAAAPSLLAENGRINQFARAVIDSFVPGKYEGVDEYRQVGQTFLNMFSGLSNAFKAQYILEHGKIVTSTGQSVDDDVSYMEALVRGATGFQTRDEVYYWAGNQAKWEIDGQIDKDIEYLVDDMFIKLTRENFDIADYKEYQKIMAEASRVFGNKPAYMDKIAQYYQFKTRQNPDTLYRYMLMSGLYTPEQVVKVINNSGFTKEQIDTLMEMHNITGASYGD